MDSIQQTQYASRAGEKLEHAIEHFKIDVSGKTCADFGASTGGFTDCLLQHGAKKIYSIDTCYGELAWKLRNNSKVVVMERTNALHVQLPEKVDIVTVDVGWTPQKLILPNALNQLKPNGIVLSLLKPHYEAQQKQRYKGKVRTEHMDEILNTVKTELANQRIIIHDIVESPLQGRKGKNTEYIMLIKNVE